MKSGEGDDEEQKEKKGTDITNGRILAQISNNTGTTC